ncbi:small GTP-binding protein [Tritrichomonas foetus]|uniref:Small GTP-binding protein n=1 Tax=Tritrichomonas foetus TaxID=1144522 RepID=A0A1J4JRW4_9EUKA|nr:small GTP-binding protein [Tritrichomonas foetus]|eukprot:OHT01779.1 small GTP-binding protein [Tritrichomonas foetus]
MIHQKFISFTQMSAAKKPKLVIVGDGGVGKTSIIVRYTRDQFSQGYEPTLEDNYQATIKIDDTTSIDIEIADTAGQEDYKALRDKYMAEGDAFFIVYSIIDARSLQMAESLLDQITLLKENSPFKFILVGNKCDMEGQRQVSKVDGKNLADKHSGLCFETSALSKQNIDVIFAEIGKMLLDKNKGEGGSGGCCNIA